jgi:hypothetical protein
MRTKIDIAKFESLGGRELADYVLKLLKSDFEDNSFVEFVGQRAAGWDDNRLSYAISLLAKISTPAACRQISNHLTNPSANVRFLAMNAVRSLQSVYEHIMKQVVNSMSNPIDPGDPDYLRVVLERPSSAGARRIAAEYLANRRASGILARVRRAFGIPKKGSGGST